MKTKAVRIYGKKDLRLDEFELPDIKDNEILAQVISDSLCMSSHKAALQGADHKRIPDDIHVITSYSIHYTKLYESALGTAGFLASQNPNGSAYIIGDAGLIHALYSVGYTINNVNPDYVVVGDTHGYNFRITSYNVCYTKLLRVPQADHKESEVLQHMH